MLGLKVPDDYEVNSVAGAWGLRRPEDPHGLLGDNWVDTDPSTHMWAMRDWLSETDFRAHRSWASYRAAAQAMLDNPMEGFESSTEWLTQVVNGEIDPREGKLHFVADRVAAAHANAAARVIEIKQTLIEIVLEGNAEIDAADDADRADLIEKLRGDVTTARAEFDQSMSDQTLSAVPRLSSDPIHYALRDLRDLVARRGSELHAVSRRDGKEFQLYPRPPRRELSDNADADDAETESTGDQPTSTDEEPTETSTVKPATDLDDVVGAEFADDMKLLYDMLQPEKDMPDWLQHVLDSRRETARAARERAAQYPNFLLEGLDSQMAIQINGAHALIRAQCEALATREEMYIEDVRRMWRTMKTHPVGHIPTPPCERITNLPLAAEGG